MPNIPHTVICAACGRRPATIQVVSADGAGRHADALCEPCVQRLFAAAQAQAAGAFGAPAGAPRGDARAQQPETESSTPALDGFGRDLTDDARGGRIDPVVGRTAEIEETVEILSRRR